jgi:polysaccharide export outer membrane protein
MKNLPCTLLTILLLPTAGPIWAQVVAKPVISAPPAASSNPPAPPASTTAQPPAASSVQVDANYVIGANDSLKVDVWQNPQLSAILPVRPDGKISLPLINDIQAAGYTPMQFAGILTDRFKQFVTDPLVNVTVMAVNSKEVFVLGEVAHVGPLQLSPGMTILQAISTAGGLTPYANKKKIYILRGTQRIPFDYNKAARKGDMQGITLAPGDTILVQ